MKATATLCLLMAMPLVAMAQWSSNPDAPMGISTPGRGGQMLPKASQNAKGDIFVSYIEPNNGYNLWLKMQRLTKDGVALWETGGLDIDTNYTMSWTGDYDMKATPDGGAVVVWGDSRVDPELCQTCLPYAYKVDEDGNPEWGLNGIALPCEQQGMTYSICLVEDGVIVGYHNFVGSDDIQYRLVKLNYDGTFAWSTPKDYQGMWGTFTLTSDGYIMTLLRSGDLVARRFNKDAEPVWDEWITVENRGVDGHALPVVQSDGNDGLVIAYRRLFDYSGMAAIQHIENDGSKTMGLRSVDLYEDEIGNHSSTIAMGVKPATQEIVCLWEMQIAGYQLQVNKLNFDGDFAWDSESGKMLLGVSDLWGYTGGAVLPLEEGWLLLYGNTLKWNTTDVCLAKMSDSGNIEWTKTMMNGAAISRPIIWADSEQGYMIWQISESAEDSHTTETAIRGQNFTFDAQFGTGIEELHTDALREGQLYDLQGRPVKGAAKSGLFIRANR